MDFHRAYDEDQFRDILDSNANAPNVDSDAVGRLIELARQRANDRGDYNALDDEETDVLFTTNWTNYCTDNFGYSNDDICNRFALGIHNEPVSARKDAHLFTETHVIQHDWLLSGDGRKPSVDMYVDEDFDSDGGTLWLPKSITEYFCIIVLDDELLHGEPTASEAM